MQNRKLLKIIGFGLLAFVIIYIFSKKDQVAICELDIVKIENFDLILSKGQSVQSKLINLLHLTVDDYSHIGILMNNNNKLFVLHATPDGSKMNGIRYDELQTFIELSSVSDFKILRYKDIPYSCREKLNKEFETYKTIQAPFDFDFNNFESKNIYCSELVWIIFKNSGLFCNSDFDSKKTIYPKEFLKMKQLTSVNVKKTSP